jgi:DNA repair protein RadC
MIHPVMEAALRPLSIRSEDPPPYRTVEPNEDTIIEQAMAVLHKRLNTGPLMNSTDVVKKYLMLKAAGLEREEFWCVWLNAVHQVIDIETVATGSISQASVYPREIVKSALRRNAAAVILAHNHPSGSPDPSNADQMLTNTIKSALALVDVRVVDHIIVGGDRAVSFAEQGLV